MNLAASVEILLGPHVHGVTSPVYKATTHGANETHSSRTLNTPERSNRVRVCSAA
jgi:hypothetical protein